MVVGKIKEAIDINLQVTTQEPRMKKAYGRMAIGLTTFLIVVLLGIFVWQRQKDEPPTIRVEQPEHNFGDLQQQVTVKHTYRFTNTGRQDLKITGFKKSCACSVTRLPSEPIATGQWGEITIEFKTENQLGQISQRAIIETNDPQQPIVPLTFSARIVRDLVVTPPLLFFGEVPHGQESSETIRLIDGGTRTLSVQNAHSTNSYMKCFVEQDATKDDSKNYRVIVSLARDTPLGRHKGEIRISTNSTKHPEVAVPVVALVVGNVKVSPHELILRATAKESYTRRIIIESSRDDFRVEGIATASSNIQGHIKDVLLEGKRRYELELEILPLAGQSKYAGTITLKTNDLLQPVVEIPYSTEPLKRTDNPVMH